MSKIILHKKGILFDMDGVITNTMPDHYRAWESVLKDEGIRVTHLDIYSREGQRGIFSVRELFAEYKKPLTATMAKRILEKKEMIFKKRTKTRFISGARRFLKDVHRKGFIVGLVTGTARHEVEKILPEDLRNCFSAIITGTDVKKGKPHPEPFLKCLKALKLQAKEAVVLENAPFGIRSAKDAKIQCLAIETSLPKKYLSEADYVFHSYADIQKRLSLRKI
jgi:beta-phosphoglucomutase